MFIETTKAAMARIIAGGICGVGGVDVKKLLTLAAALLMLAPLSVEAKTLYVNASSGNDATSYAANGPSAPWRTIGRAAWGSTNRGAPNASEAARAGDIVMVSAGTYSVPGTNTRYDPAYNPVNSGTAGNLITFQADGAVTLTLSSSVGPVIGSNGKDYIKWKGFTIDEVNAPSTPDTGPVTVFTCRGCVFEDLTLRGNDLPDDNHPAIYLATAHQVTVRNNRISGFLNGPNNHDTNASGVLTYYSDGLLIEQNEISGCGSGIFLKGNYPPAPTAGSTIRNNLIYNVVHTGIAVHVSPQPDGAPIRIHQNIISGAGYSGIRIWPFGDPVREPRLVQAVNNTIFNARIGVELNGTLIANARHMFWNNIVYGSSTYAVNHVGGAGNLTVDKIDFEHNIYTAGNVTLVGDGREMSLSTWKTTFNQDNEAPASSSVNPLFVSATDLRLQGSSPARNAGVDVFDLDGDGSNSDPIALGAYAVGNEVIGRTSGSTLPPPTGTNPPAAPTNVRIVR